MTDKNQNEGFVIGDEIEPDESRTPAEFAREELLTIEQVAHELNCSAIQVREWIASGMLTPIAEGSVERIKRSELRRLGDPQQRAARKFEKEHDSE